MLAWKSISIRITASTLPRKCAATKPMAVPKAAAIMVPKKAISRLSRIDMMSRESTSRPSSSLPSGCAHLPPMNTGGSRRARRSKAVKE